MSDFPIITSITLLPLIGGLMVVGFGEEQKGLARKLALGFSFASLDRSPGRNRG